MEKVIYDYSKLRGRIKEKCGTQDNFATALGISSVAVSSKLNNKTYFEQPEMVRAGVILDIPSEELHKYFFCKTT